MRNQRGLILLLFAMALPMPAAEQQKDQVPTDSGYEVSHGGPWLGAINPECGIALDLSYEGPDKPLSIYLVDLRTKSSRKLRDLPTEWSISTPRRAILMPKGDQILIEYDKFVDPKKLPNARYTKLDAFLSAKTGFPGAAGKQKALFLLPVENVVPVCLTPEGDFREWSFDWLTQVICCTAVENSREGTVCLDLTGKRLAVLGMRAWDYKVRGVGPDGMPTTKGYHGQPPAGGSLETHPIRMADGSVFVLANMEREVLWYKKTGEPPQSYNNVNGILNIPSVSHHGMSTPLVIKALCATREGTGLIVCIGDGNNEHAGSDQIFIIDKISDKKWRKVGECGDCRDLVAASDSQSVWAIIHRTNGPQVSQFVSKIELSTGKLKNIWTLSEAINTAAASRKKK